MSAATIMDDIEPFLVRFAKSRDAKSFRNTICVVDQGAKREAKRIAELKVHLEARGVQVFSTVPPAYKGAIIALSEGGKFADTVCNLHTCKSVADLMIIFDVMEVQGMLIEAHKIPFPRAGLPLSDASFLKLKPRGSLEAFAKGFGDLKDMAINKARERSAEWGVASCLRTNTSASKASHVVQVSPRSAPANVLKETVVAEKKAEATASIALAPCHAHAENVALESSAVSTAPNDTVDSQENEEIASNGSESGDEDSFIPKNAMVVDKKDIVFYTSATEFNLPRVVSGLPNIDLLCLIDRAPPAKTVPTTGAMLLRFPQAGPTWPPRERPIPDSADPSKVPRYVNSLNVGEARVIQVAVRPAAAVARANDLAFVVGGKIWVRHRRILRSRGSNCDCYWRFAV